MTMTPAAGVRSRGSRLLPRLIVLVLLTLAAGVGLAGPASAHNVLTSSDPTNGSTLQTAPSTVRLTFDQPVQDFEPVITVIGPDGNRYEAGAPVVDSTVVTASINPLPVAGAYSIAWRVVSADGHPVEGQIKFELAQGGVSDAGGSSAAAVGTGASGATAAESTTTGGSPAAAAPTASSSGLSGWVWAAIAVAAILIVAAVVVIVRGPRRT